jgi:diadenosine tetraphosphate (Ap4A) HIT family hydrolase
MDKYCWNFHLSDWVDYVELEEVGELFMTTLIHLRVEEAQAGTNPTVICRVPSGWVVIGDRQLLRGYCLLLPDPVVVDLNALSMEQRVTYLRDMSIVGDALLEITGAARINYETLGNTEHALHTHIVPRYSDEPDEFRSIPVWFYDWDKAPKFNLERDQDLMKQLANSIQNRLNSSLEIQL